MKHIIYSGTALFLLVNPFILHQNNRTMHPTHVFIVWKEDASFTAMFNSLCSSTNQQLFKNNFCNQSSHYENYGWFIGSHHVPTTKLTLFVVHKDEWYTKESRAKSMKNALYIQRYGKRHLLGWSNVEQQKNQARSLSYASLKASGRQAGRQAGSQSVENFVK